MAAPQSFQRPYTSEPASQLSVPLQTPKRVFHYAPETVFIGVGTLLLTILCTVPLSNAVALILDVNYTYWAGSHIPQYLIALCILSIAFYTLTALVFFNCAPARYRSDESTIMLVACIFVTVLGLSFMLVSMPLSQQAIETHNNLIYRCDYSEQTSRLYEYSQVLQQIRQQPECMKKFSVEQCEGYEPAPPYTTFLKDLENNFACAGFCYRPQLLPKLSPSVNKSSSLLVDSGMQKTSSLAAVLSAAAAEGRLADPAPSLAAQDPALIAIASTANSTAKPDKKSKSTTAKPVAKPSATAKVTRSGRPPTLFSNYNFSTSCEGMAAGDIQSFAGDIGYMTFMQGIFYVLITFAMGFIKILSVCFSAWGSRNVLHPPGSSRSIYAKATGRSV